MTGFCKSGNLWLLCIFCMMGIPSLACAQEKPKDPFDYNFCGGERVYPVVGVEFATACGPRNIIALGRRGKISWFFPGPDGTSKGQRMGAFRLTDKQLFRLSLLAEVVQVADVPKPVAARVQYRFGLNFSGRELRRIHTGVTDDYVPSTHLFQQMLKLVPDKPLLPDCPGKAAIFDPILPMTQRITQ